MSGGAIIVINPNSSQGVTDGIDAALAPFRAYGVPIRCLTLAEGPPGIESQLQADLTIAPMLALAARHEAEAAAFVIACFGDPGLFALRDQSARPVLGIQESAVAMALTQGQRFGIISILPASVPRHYRALGAMGVLDRLAGDRAIGRGVAALAEDQSAEAAMIETGLALRDMDGADVLVMGCAGMARFRPALERATGLPVIEPCQAAVGMALARIALDQG